METEIKPIQEQIAYLEALKNGDSLTLRDLRSLRLTVDSLITKRSGESEYILRKLRADMGYYGRWVSTTNYIQPNECDIWIKPICEYLIQLRESLI